MGLPRDVILAELGRSQRVSRPNEEALSEAGDDDHAGEASEELVISNVVDTCAGEEELQLGPTIAVSPGTCTPVSADRNSQDGEDFASCNESYDERVPEENDVVSRAIADPLNGDDVELTLPASSFRPDSTAKEWQEEEMAYECARIIASYPGELPEHRTTVASQLAFDNIKKASIKGELSLAAPHADDATSESSAGFSEKVRCFHAFTRCVSDRDECNALRCFGRGNGTACTTFSRGQSSPWHVCADEADDLYQQAQEELLGSPRQDHVWGTASPGGGLTLPQHATHLYRTQRRNCSCGNFFDMKQCRVYSGSSSPSSCMWCCNSSRICVTGTM